MKDEDQIYYKRKLTGRLKEISDLHYLMVDADREETERLAGIIRRLNDQEAQRHANK